MGEQASIGAPLVSLLSEVRCACATIHSRVVQVLVATSTLAWGVNTPAHLVIIKGTEYFDAPTKRCALTFLPQDSYPWLFTLLPVHPRCASYM